MEDSEIQSLKKTLMYNNPSEYLSTEELLNEDNQKQN